MCDDSVCVSEYPRRVFCLVPLALATKFAWASQYRFDLSGEYWKSHQDQAENVFLPILNSVRPERAHVAAGSGGDPKNDQLTWAVQKIVIFVDAPCSMLSDRL